MWNGKLYQRNHSFYCDCCHCSVTKSGPTLRDLMNYSMPGSSALHYFLEFAQNMSIELIMLSSHLILWCLLLLWPSIFPSIRVFSNESVVHIRWPKCWSFSFSISPSNEYSGLISFRMDWLDLLDVQGTLQSLRQHHSSTTSVLRRSAFFTVQLSRLYVSTGKTITLTRRTLLAK